MFKAMIPLALLLGGCVAAPVQDAEPITTEERLHALEAIAAEFEVETEMTEEQARRINRMCILAIHAPILAGYRVEVPDTVSALCDEAAGF